ncbi:hypothetical protein ASPZODRAFT_147981 [Penicilliopsis zonata CBS 506.65]|uniref:AMP-dependent synthetase/ligase domain-containing protein n=1 Tax=Penicilliopsis zonata CBS 506.65 TaxID=1073090 RepID=A0A1L9STE4_9EURO|nr:hypothetical protein ASPZODRAFT_147981 [Penicilliopsis zonata CBS 506.65]OJJ50468.1 hypothetical protein ASPZODRAFT_147981 [Penicilliopsis zonata CBS 506.65]
MHIQDAIHAASLHDPHAFWSHHAAQLHWHRAPSQVLAHTRRTLADGSSHAAWSWFPDGELSTTFNCVDRHVAAGRGDCAAIVFDSPVTQTVETITYAQLQEEVELLAGVLREEAQVEKGDVVLLYMPMIPAALIAALAIARLGAIHAAVFGGFAAPSLAQRIDAAQPKVIMTASCGIEGVKGPLAYRPLVEGAIAASNASPQRVIVWQREQMPWNLDEARGQRDWRRLVQSARLRRVRCPAVPVKSTDGLYIIYTSGTTGLPKGVLREAGGHAVGLSLSIRYLFDIHGPGDVMFCASDIGWVVGHSYILYAPLLVGATTVLYEGKPVGTPDAGQFWRTVERHRVKVLFTAPTALRAILRDDPHGSLLEEVGRRGGLKTWRALFLAGERSEPSLVQRFQDLLARHAAPGAMVVDNWWSSESGSPISGLALAAAVGNPPGTDSTSQNEILRPLPVKPGSAGKPMPGFDVRIVDDQGIPVQAGTMGNIVLALPLAPTAFTTLFRDEARFYASYLRRFAGRWFDTGDAGMLDEQGYLHVMARSDDIINVAAHRFSTGPIEQAILSHPAVGEACVVGLPDSLKGHLPFAFVQLRQETKDSKEPPSADLFNEINGLVRHQIGAIASLGGLIVGNAMIPKTRSGKTLRRVLRQLLEQGSRGEFDGPVNLPPTIEDGEVINVARMYIQRYFTSRPKL